MQESQADLSITLPYNASVKVVISADETITSDAGVLPMRVVMDKAGVAERIAAGIKDDRDPDRIQHPLPDLLRQLLLQRVQGWGRQSDADKLREDGALRVATTSQRGIGALQDKKALASQPSMSRLVSLLAKEGAFEHLRCFVETFAMENLLRSGGGERREEIVFDVDGVPIDAHGKQRGSAFNAYYNRNIFLPLIAICGETGDILGGELRGGAQSVVRDSDKIMRRIGLGLRRHVADKVTVRLDAGFNSGELCDKLEQDGIDYVMRLKSNAALKKLAEPHLAGGQPPCRQYHELRYQAQNWSVERRVVLVVDPVPGELFPWSFLLITSHDKEAYTAAELGKMYRQRGKAEKHFGELKATCFMAFSSVDRPKKHYQDRPIERQQAEEVQQDEIRPENRVLLQIDLLTYQLMKVGCDLMLEPAQAKNDSLGQEPESTPAECQLPLEPAQAKSDSLGQEPESTPAECQLPQEPAQAKSDSLGQEPESTPAECQLPQEPAGSPISLPTFRTQVLKVGARFVRHARNIVIRVAGSALAMWEHFWLRISRLRWIMLPMRC